jgi:peptide/nickel transport system substrate-binding protein
VKWQDGAPFTSADVRFSWEAVMNPHNNVGSREGYDRVTRIDTPDPYTAVVHLTSPYVLAVPRSLPGMIPAHLLRGTDLNTGPFNSAPIGTGPFKVVAWKRGDSVELVANPTYYRGKPKLAAIRVMFVHSAATRAVMLATRELDLAELDRDAYRQLARTAHAQVTVAPENSLSLYFLNVTRPNLRDVRVRRAIALAIDRRALVRAGAFADDVDTLASGIAGPGSFAYDAQRPQAPFDPKRAAQLLDAAGWHLGPDGIRVRDGRRLSLQIAQIAGATSFNADNTFVQAMLHAVGIEIDIKTYSAELIFAPAAAKGILAVGTFDLFHSAYFNGFDPDSSWYLTCARVEPQGYNESRYCNPHLDALEYRALLTDNIAQRKRLYAAIDATIRADVPIVMCVWPKAVYASNPALRGFAFNGASATWNAADWSL